MSTEHSAGQSAGGLFERILSWSAFVLLAIATTGFAWSIPRHREVTRQLLVDFKLELPEMTNAVLAVPTWLVYCLSAAAMVGGLLVQLRRPEKASTATFHLLLIFAFGVAYFGYRDAMMQPLIGLIEGISSPRR